MKMKLGHSQLKENVNVRCQKIEVYHSLAFSNCHCDAEGKKDLLSIISSKIVR